MYYSSSIVTRPSPHVNEFDPVYFFIHAVTQRRPGADPPFQHGAGHENME